MRTTLQIRTCCPRAPLVFCLRKKCNRTSMSGHKQDNHVLLLCKSLLGTVMSMVCASSLLKRTKYSLCRLSLDNRGEHHASLSSCSRSHSFALTGLRIGRKSFLASLASTQLIVEVLCINVTKCWLKR